MSNLFTHNPIKINVISVDNDIKQKLVFVGDVSGDIAKILQKIENTQKLPRDTKILAKFYGGNWSHKLGLNRLHIEGGANADADADADDNADADDEFSFDSPELIQDDEIANISNTRETSKQGQKKLENEMRDLKEEVSTPLEIGELDVVLDDELISVDELEDTEPHVKTEQIQMGRSSGVRFIKSYIYPEDDILTFKKKIYTVLKIPIYRQHVWYVFQGRTFALSYSVFSGNSLLYVNIQKMLDNIKKCDMIETIPINNKFYQMKKTLKVETQDTFSIMKNYYNNYNITEYNIIDLDDFIRPSRSSLQKIVKERFQMELIYYSFIVIYWPMMSLDVFSTYMKSEADIARMYPELATPIEKLNKSYKLEQKIIDTKYNLINNPQKKKDLMHIDKLMINSIVSAIISVLKYQNSQESILNIRNLFDKYMLSDYVISCKCRINYNDKIILLSKVYKQYPRIRETPEINSIIYKIKVNPETNRTISLIFYANGNYVIKSTWREENHRSFNDIFSIVNTMIQPIIKTINSFGSYVLSNNKTIPFMSKKNSKFTEIGMHIFYKKGLSASQFDLLKQILDNFKKAGIMREKNIENSMVEYYFRKGMYQFQSKRIERVAILDNYYDFLTDGIIKQKWHSIFEKTRITKVFHRMSDVKIEIIGIKEHEFATFYEFIQTIFDIYGNRVKHHKEHKKDASSHAISAKKTLKNLKEQDPILYNFKKIYKTENIYSKTCQKQHQPILFNKQKYAALSKKEKSLFIKYWNFTTNTDAYYKCPNHKFPFLKFITKKHPKDYCIPCCQISKISSDKKHPKKIIHDICMKDHKYTKAARTITTGSRYIMSYGKDIEPGRLSRLPDDSLEPLFYETYSVNEQGVDVECMTTDGYYLYGINQRVNGVCAGMLNILTNAMELNISEFIIKLIKLVKNEPSKFRILLNGKINKFFTSSHQFTSVLKQLFLDPPNGITHEEYKNYPWNKIFISAAYLFMRINIVYFKHLKNRDIKLSIPSYINSKEQFLSSEFKHLIVLQKRNKFYPIYLLNTNVFFKTKLFTKKIFESNSSIIVIMGRLIDAYFSNQVKQNIHQKITFGALSKFIKNTPYTLHKIYVNAINMCYYAHLKKKNKDVYVPIALSYFLNTNKFNITYDMFLRSKNKIKMEELLTFAKDFNDWVAIESKKAGMLIEDADTKLPLVDRVRPIYPYIKIHSWLVLTKPAEKTTITKNSQVIGFISNNLHYYTVNTTLKKTFDVAKKFKHAVGNNTKIFPIYYDPDVVNKQIFIKSKPIIDSRCINIGKSIYNNNLYHLIVLEFIEVFNKQKNTKLREKIKKILSGNLNKDFDDVMETIGEIIADCDDYNKFKLQICEYVNHHHNKKLLFAEINESTYNFDRKLLEYIKSLPVDKVFRELEKIAQKFVVYGNVNKISKFKFPNMYISCQSMGKKGNQLYCKKNKFIIDKKKLSNLLHILAADIVNPVKSKWLFSGMLSDNVVNFFKFKRNPSEHILILIE